MKTPLSMIHPFISLVSALVGALLALSSNCGAREKKPTKEPITITVAQDAFALEPTDAARAKIYVPPTFQPKYLTATITSQFTGSARITAAWHLATFGEKGRYFTGGLQDQPISLVAGKPTKVSIKWLSFVVDDNSYRELAAKKLFEDDKKFWPIEGQHYHGWLIAIMDRTGNVVAHTESSAKTFDAWMKAEKKTLRKPQP